MVNEPPPLRPACLPPDPAGRTSYAAGEIAQCDFWFPDIELPVGFGQARAAKLLPVLTMVCGYSRFALAMLLPSRTAGGLNAGWWLEQLGAVPKVLVWDGEGAVGRWRARRVELSGDSGAKINQPQPWTPATLRLDRCHRTDIRRISILPRSSAALGHVTGVTTLRRPRLVAVLAGVPQPRPHPFGERAQF